MTFAMSTEGDSIKNAVSEASEKSDQQTTDESSQDSIVKDTTQEETPLENNSEEKSEINENDVKEDQKNQKQTDETKNEEFEKIDNEDEKSKDKDANTKESVGASSEKDEEEEMEDEKVDEDAEKKGVPLLDQPLETTGKRERKTVQKFEEETKKQEPAKVEFEEGRGTALGEIPRVEASITRFKNDDLKFLHKLLFKVQGNKNLFKKNIRKFSGFAFEQDSDDFRKKQEFLRKTEVKYLKTTCEILDLPKSGAKDDIVERILEFLLEPKDSGKPVGGTGRPKRASAVRANNRGYSSHDDYSSDERQGRARRDKGKRANLKDDSSSDEEFNPGDVTDGSDDKPTSKRKRGRARKGSSEEDEEEEASLTDASSDESDDMPKAKRRKSFTKNNKGTPKRRGRPAKSTASVTTPRSKGKRGRRPKDDTSEDEEKFDDEGSSSEDEPLAKKKAKPSEPPTDEEIKDFIKTVLEGANLEEITMKTVCQRVYDHYPDFDLTSRKNFIKTTVKSLIST
ncbi:hypothetical protein ABEB36_006842 [Hypothenemus hampei]|uniref:Protein DEK n=1 Tax=Hypothenemus hampei TaxID=57062 RepID=A0ABD1EUZ6_HYPHA